MHPAARVDRLAGRLLVVPVAPHDDVAAAAQLARRPTRHDHAGGRVDDLDLDVRVDPADGGHPPLERVVGRALGGDGRGLCHAVGNRHLGDVHHGLHLFHHLDRARRAGHDAGAQRAEVEVLEAWVLELADEHRRHAVEGGAALLLHGLHRRHRVVGLGRNHHRRAVRRAREVAQHHAEAVVEGHRDADAVPLRVLQRLADEEAVVEDVVVSERGPLREARRARGVLDVDRVVELERGLELMQLVCLDLRRVALEGIPPVLQHQRLAQGGAPALDLGEHGAVVGLAKPGGQDQEAGAGLVERVLELARPVRRVDVDQDRAHRRGRVLHDHPLVAIGGPDADAVAFLHTARHQAASDLLALRDELAVGRAVALMRDDERFAVAVPRSGAAQVGEDGLAEKRLLASPVDIAQLSHRSHLDWIGRPMKNPLDIVLGSSQAGGSSFSVGDHRQFTQRLASTSRQRP